MDRDERKLMNQQLKDEDLNEFKNTNKLKTDTTIDSTVIYQNDKVLQKLRDNVNPQLREINILPDDICNVLKAEID